MNDKLIRVLVIDDDPEDALLAAVALRSSRQPSCEVQHVANLADASEHLQSCQFDIVLLDLGLRESQGLETLDRFREQDDSIPVVVLSGLEDEQIAVQSMEHHAQDYLFKNDVNPKSLQRAIRYAIHRQATVRENRRLLARVRENEEVLLRKNERLRALYETAHTFVDNVSHEFRTPLTVIKEYISLVSDGTMGEITEQQRQFLNIAEDRANDLNTMVDDMLDVSKLEAGLLGVHRNSHEVKTLVDRVLQTLHHKAMVRELHLELDVPEDLPRVFCDSEKMERVIINLAINAMKFTRPGGHVCIWARTGDQCVEFGVTDDGPGIAKDSLKQIFKRFKQVEVDARASTKGFGLGLGIAKELVELNLGSIHVESEVGKGSTFWFTVPVADPIIVTQQYIESLIRARRRFVTVVFANIQSHVAEDVAEDIDILLNHLVRGSDLAFRANSHRWILLLPEPARETNLFLDRAAHELELANRNRPKGRLPDVEFHVEASWPDLRITAEEVISRVRSQFGSEQPLYV